ncbi:MAG: Holliday junction branch migration DNA helicase RuvB [Proteobacteria bacterium]|nr:Holliday junction branch migration DNA helicase RuvB [Pseudomonadota bacterium]
MINRLDSDVRKVSIERISSSLESEEDYELQDKAPSIRPSKFSEYPGQLEVKRNLQVYVEASKLRKKTLDHIILHGAPGLGKTTLANIVANELGVPFVSTSGPAIDKAGDLAGILTGLEPGTLLFIDEIHRLSIKVEEILYGAMEDFAIDLIVGQAASARSVRMEISPFTLVGATTRLSLLSRPLLSRFGIQERLEFYDSAALEEILTRSAGILDIELTPQGAAEIAKRSRGTPRLANRLLKRVGDFAAVAKKNSIDKDVAHLALLRQGVDDHGFDRVDRKILQIMQEQYSSGPVGIDALAASLHEDRATIEDVYEPYLVYRGFIARTPRGRVLTQIAEKYLSTSTFLS